MPANDGRHHHITHRPRVGTLGACVAAIMVLALARMQQPDHHACHEHRGHGHP